jgi:hypothetical protein
MNFKYGDKVKVIGGFYAGFSGFCFGEPEEICDPPSKERVKIIYPVTFTQFGNEHPVVKISEECLEKIE